MKVLKKLLPLLVVVTILVSVAIIPASASSDEVDDTVGRWYYFDTLPAGGFRVEGRFLLPSYTYHGTYHLFDFNSYRVYDVLYYTSNQGLYASNEFGSVQLSTSSGVIPPYNCLIFVDSLKDTYNYDNQSAFFDWINSLEICSTFRIDNYVIPYRGGEEFSEISQYIPNLIVLPPYDTVMFKVNYDTPEVPLYWDVDLIYGYDVPSDYSDYFTISPNSEGVLTGFGAISSWLSSSLGSLDGLFFNQGSLTPLGIFCIISLSIGLALLLFNIVKNFLRLR